MQQPPDSFEFEVTDFGSARLALDELPSGVKEAMNLAPGYWEKRRRKPVPTDKALTGAAIDWLLSLPADVRPQAMCDKFPRLVNQIAQRWDDPGGTADALRRLVEDDRGGRQGFPKDVAIEIDRLRLHALRHSAAMKRAGRSGADDR